MSFVQREHDKLMTLCQNTPIGPAYDALYTAKQALAWALDPNAVSSPSAYIGKFYDVPVDGTQGTGITPGVGALAGQPAPASTALS
jgi:hypothetical protein